MRTLLTCSSYDQKIRFDPYSSENVIVGLLGLMSYGLVGSITTHKTNAGGGGGDHSDLSTWYIQVKLHSLVFKKWREFPAVVYMVSE